MDTHQILKADYLDLLFDGRNKNYGSYELRKSYNSNAFIGAVSAFGAFSIVFLSAMLFKSNDQSLTAKPPDVVVQLTDIKPEYPDKKILPPPAQNIQPPAKGMTKSTEIVVKPDNEVSQRDLPHLTKPEENKIIGPQDIAGASDDPMAVNPNLNTVKGRPGGLPLTSGMKSDQPFTIVDQQPVPPGGFEAFQRYLASHAAYPPAAKQAGLQGRVAFQFVVNIKGEISDIKILKDIGGGTGEEVLRVLESYHEKWTPARNNGYPVKAYFVGYFNFALQ